MRLVASPDGAEGSVTIYQDARIYAVRLNGTEVAHALAPKRRAWVQVARGEVELNGQRLVAGDGATLEEETAVKLAAADSAEALLFDLP